MFHDLEVNWDNESGVMSGRFILSNIGSVPFTFGVLEHSGRVRADFYLVDSSRNDTRAWHHADWEARFKGVEKVFPSQNILYEFSFERVYPYVSRLFPYNNVGEAELQLRYIFENTQVIDNNSHHVYYLNQCIKLGADGARTERSEDECNPWKELEGSGPRRLDLWIDSGRVPPLDVWDEWNLTEDDPHAKLRRAVEFVQTYELGNETPFWGTVEYHS